MHDAGDPHRGGPLPQIRLQGKWLQQAGFRPGGHVRIQVEAGRLTIESATGEADHGH